MCLISCRDAPLHIHTILFLFFQLILVCLYIFCLSLIKLSLLLVFSVQTSAVVCAHVIVSQCGVCDSLNSTSFSQSSYLRIEKRCTSLQGHKSSDNRRLSVCESCACELLVIVDLGVYSGRFGGTSSKIRKSPFPLKILVLNSEK